MNLKMCVYVFKTEKHCNPNIPEARVYNTNTVGSRLSVCIQIYLDTASTTTYAM